MVEGDDFARELCDVSAWHWGDNRSQTNTLCTHCHRGQCDPGVRSWFFELEMVPDEKAVPAGLFCLIRKISENRCVSAEVKVRRVESKSHARESTGSPPGFSTVRIHSKVGRDERGDERRWGSPKSGGASPLRLNAIGEPGRRPIYHARPGPWAVRCSGSTTGGLMGAGRPARGNSQAWADDCDGLG